MTRLLASLLITALLPLAAAAQGCQGCGCRGGPGYRGPDGRCVGWAKLRTVCGNPPTTRCTAEIVAPEVELFLSDPGASRRPPAQPNAPEPAAQSE